MAKALETTRTEIIKLIDEYNEAFKANDLAKTTKIEESLREAEADYAETKLAEVFAEFMETETPIRAAFEKHSYPVVSHKTIREDGVVKGIEFDDGRMKRIDLAKICKYCKIDNTWKSKVEQVNQSLAVRTALDLDLPKKKFEELCRSFAKDSAYMMGLLAKVGNKETPVSDTAICKTLQSVVDTLLFEDNGKNKNALHALNRDVAYIIKNYTKRGKKVLNVALAKQGFVNSLIVDVMHRLVTGKTYGLEYQLVTPDTADSKAVETSNPKSADTVVVEKPKAETAEVSIEVEPE